MPVGLLALFQLLLLLPLLALACSKKKKTPANPNEVLPPAGASKNSSLAGTPGSAPDKPANDAVDVEP